MLNDLGRDALDRQMADFHAHERPAGSLGDIGATPDPAERGAAVGRDRGRRVRLLELPDPGRLRQLAGDIRGHTLDHLGEYLRQFASAVEQRGGRVHCAADLNEAATIVGQIVKAGAIRSVWSGGGAGPAVDGATGELSSSAGVARDGEATGGGAGLLAANAALSAAWRTAGAVDVGEGGPADMAVVDGRFLIAQTGAVCVVDTEGGTGRALAGARVTLCVAGIERVLPRLGDLAVMLKLLARSARGEAMMPATHLIGTAGGAGESGVGTEDSYALASGAPNSGKGTKSGSDARATWHVLLIDGGRSDLLADADYRDTLRCIDCGACANVCPVYRQAGGQATAGRYPGPIDALRLPLLGGAGGLGALADYADLPHASTLCGACAAACPVMIDLPAHLRRLRRDAAGRELTRPIDRALYRVWAWGLAGGGGSGWGAAGWVGAARGRVARWAQRWALRRRFHGERRGESQVAPAPERFADKWKRQRQSVR